MNRTRALPLVLIGTIGKGAAHWYIVWLIASFYGPEQLGNYSVLLAGATPIFILTGLGLRNVFLTLGGAPPWKHFLHWRLIGMAIGGALLALYGALTLPTGSVIAAMIAMKAADGTLDIFMARVQRANRLKSLGVLMIANAALTVALCTLAALIPENITPLLWASAIASAGLIPFAWRQAKEWKDPAFRQRESNRVFRAAVPVTAATFLMTLISSAPVWYLQATSSLAEVGRFSSAAYLIVFANLLGASIQTTLLPTYRSIFEKHGVDGLRITALRHSLYLHAAGVTGTIAVVVFGDWGLRLIYGRAFGASWLELAAYGLTAYVCLTGYLWSTVLLVRNMYRAQMFTAGVSVLGVSVPLAVSMFGGFMNHVLIAALAMTCAYSARALLARLLAVKAMPAGAS